MIDPVQTQTLLGPGPVTASASVSDLLTGNAGNVTQSVLTPPATASNLTANQSNALQSLQSFVANNLEGDQATSLLAQIEALQSLIEFGNDQAALDPVFSLLSTNSDAFQTLPGGSVVNQLL